MLVALVALALAVAALSAAAWYHYSKDIVLPKSDQGIDLEISSDARFHECGEPILVAVTLSSSRDEAVWLPPFLPRSKQWSGRIYRGSSAPSQTVVHVRGHDGSIERRYGGSAWFWRQGIDVPAKGNATDGFWLQEGWIDLPPGIYRVRLEYRAETDKLKIHLISNTITVRVVEALPKEEGGE